MLHHSIFYLDGAKNLTNFGIFVLFLCGGGLLYTPLWLINFFFGIAWVFGSEVPEGYRFCFIEPPVAESTSPEESRNGNVQLRASHTMMTM